MPFTSVAPMLLWLLPSMMLMVLPTDGSLPRSDLALLRCARYSTLKSSGQFLWISVFQKESVQPGQIFSLWTAVKQILRFLASLNFAEPI